jgi:hypothetical protein
MNNHSRQRVAVLAILIIGCALTAHAQLSSGGLAGNLPNSSAASFYYVARPGELTMKVNIWGFVHNPGRYEVPTSTDLVQLISFAGGPIQDAKMSEVKITRFLRVDSLLTRGEIVANLNDLYRIDPSKLILYPGDTIFIDHTGWFTFRDVVNVVTTAAIITSAVAQVVIASRR